MQLSSHVLSTAVRAVIMTIEVSLAPPSAESAQSTDQQKNDCVSFMEPRRVEAQFSETTRRGLSSFRTESSEPDNIEKMHDGNAFTMQSVACINRIAEEMISG